MSAIMIEAWALVVHDGGKPTATLYTDACDLHDAVRDAMFVAGEKLTKGQQREIDDACRELKESGSVSFEDGSLQWIRVTP